MPAGGLGNFPNSTGLSIFLPERSNAFAMVKDSLTGMAKREMIAENMRQFAHGAVAGH